MRVAKAKMVYFNPQMDFGPNKQAQKVLILNSKGARFNLHRRFNSIRKVQASIVGEDLGYWESTITFLWKVGLDLTMAFVL